MGDLFEIIKLENDPNKRYEIEYCYCGSMFRIPLPKTEKTTLKFSCPICSTIFEVINSPDEFSLQKTEPGAEK